ncbi:CvpA family protein [Chryseolinea lacunae]|uniref:CvpA family protein n=1 Tax=Chryseolinea lacunae TaxID=2801331 RepID=A0ABS1KRB9_9BACT|nr:CvpA family protein [Chryseolinea lacunae]
MSIIDIVLIVFILIGAVGGYKEGFLIEMFSLVGIVLGVLGGFKLMGWAMVMLANRFNIDEKVLPYIAFGVVFVAIVVAVSLLARMLKASVNKTLLGSADQVAGAVLGMLKTTFMLSILLWIVDSLDIKFPSRYTEHSWVYPMVARVAPKVTQWIGAILPVFKDVF